MGGGSTTLGFILYWKRSDESSTLTYDRLPFHCARLRNQDVHIVMQRINKLKERLRHTRGVPKGTLTTVGEAPP